MRIEAEAPSPAPGPAAAGGAPDCCTGEPGTGLSSFSSWLTTSSMRLSHWWLGKGAALPYSQWEDPWWC